MKKKGKREKLQVYKCYKLSSFWSDLSIADSRLRHTARDINGISELPLKKLFYKVRTAVLEVVQRSPYNSWTQLRITPNIDEYYLIKSAVFEIVQRSLYYPWTQPRLSAAVLCPAWLGLGCVLSVRSEAQIVTSSTDTSPDLSPSLSLTRHQWPDKCQSPLSVTCPMFSVLWWQVRWIRNLSESLCCDTHLVSLSMRVSSCFTLYCAWALSSWLKKDRCL